MVWTLLTVDYVALEQWIGVNNFECQVQFFFVNWPGSVITMTCQ